VVQKRTKNVTKSTKAIQKLLKRIEILERTIKIMDFKSSLYEDRNSYEHYCMEKRIEYLENENIPF